jgi:hypothetical protein
MIRAELREICRQARRAPPECTAAMARLPTWDTVKAAFQHFFGHLWLFEVAAWPWLAILALWKAVAIAFGLSAQDSPIIQVVETGWQWLAEIAVAVAWHRAILLSEPAAGRPRFGRAELRYLGIGIALTLGMAAAFLPAGMAAGSGAPQATVGGLVMVGALIASLLAVVTARCYLALPGAAIGSAIGLAESWRRTSGNGWRLFWGMIACALPGSAVIIVWESLIDAVSQPDGLARALASLVTAGCGLAGTAIVAGFLSFAYLWFDRSARGSASP